MLLISAENLTDRAALDDNAELTAMVAAGVYAFLNGYSTKATHDQDKAQRPASTRIRS